MGWLFGWRTRRALIDHLVSGNGVHTVKHCFKGNNLWAVQEYTYPEDATSNGEPHPKAGQTARFIALYMMKGRSDSRDGWGYKDMDESSGPYVLTCPVSYLDMVPDPGGYATEWRKQVREHHALKARKFKVGTKIKYGGSEYEITKDLGRRGYMISTQWSDYRMPRSYVKDVEVLA